METNAKFDSIQIAVAPEVFVSGVTGVPPWWPSGHRGGIVLGHDVGTNLHNAFLADLQEALTRRGYLTVRFNFPYAEQRKKRPDPPQLLERAFRAAAATLVRDPQNAPARVFLGGMGLGARVASQVMAQGYAADGLIGLAYPLHPSGKPNRQRAESLFRIITPMLFVQGSRDPYCRIDRLQLLLRRIGAPSQLHVVEDADHGLGLIKRSTRSAEEVREEVLSTVDGFIQKALGGP